MKKVEEKVFLKGMKRKFQCESCGAVITSEKYILIPLPPNTCEEDQGGCGKKTKFYDITFQLQPTVEIEKCFQEVKTNG